MTKLIKNWEELAKVPANDKYQIVVDLDMCSGWIIPITDDPLPSYIGSFECHCEKGMSVHDYCEHHVYLGTHTFYGSLYKYSTKILQEHGFDIKIDNWDKER